MWWFHDDSSDDGEDRARRIRLGEMARRILGLLRPHRGGLALAMMFLLLGVGTEIVTPLVLRHLIDVNVKDRDMQGVLLSAGAYCLIFAFGTSFAYCEVVLAARVGLRAITDLKKRLFKHLLSLDLSFFDKNDPGRLMARVESDAERVRMLFAEVGLAVLRSALLLVGSLAVMFAADFDVAAVIVLVASPVVFGSYFLLRYMRRVYARARRLYARISSFVTEYLQGVPLVKAYGFADEARRRLAIRNREKLNQEVYAQFLEYGFWSFVMTMEVVTVIVILKLGSARIPTHAMTLGTMVLFIEYTRRIFFPIVMVLEQVNFIQRAFASADRVFGILDIPAGDGDRADRLDAVPRNWRTLRFEDVTLSYDGKKNALKDLSFEIRRGERVALVGLSGGGKTSIVSLLMRFYDPTAGRITLDGVDIRSFTLDAWRSGIGLVLQDIHLFPGTVGDNLRTLNDDVPREALDRAVSVVQAEDVLRQLPSGYDTLLAEGGSNLSMGQRQLVSFARALVKDPRILILDEATSAVDPATEALIRRSLDSMLEGRTSLIVAHRLSTIRGSDRIFVMHRGRLAEQGSHEELYKRRGIYRDLFDLQFKTGEVA